MSFKVGDEVYHYSYWDYLPQEPMLATIVEVRKYDYCFTTADLPDCRRHLPKDTFFSKEVAYVKYREDLEEYIQFLGRETTRAKEALEKGNL